jgi:hypothetical protein
MSVNKIRELTDTRNETGEWSLIWLHFLKVVRMERWRSLPGYPPHEIRFLEHQL